jgi:hypothetical protein
MMNRQDVVTFEKASSIFVKGRFSLMVKTRSLSSVMSATRASNSCPKASRRPQRLMEAMQSRPRTGVPSWNFSPSRSVKRHSRPSFSTTWPCAICGTGSKRSFMP